MSKISFDRPKNHLYLEKFIKSPGASNWPPKEGAERNVQDILINLIGKEIYEIIKPQLNGRTVNSFIIMQKVIEIVQKNTNFEKDTATHFDKVSKDVFTAIEEVMPTLLGQDDSSDWSWVNQDV